MKVQRQKVELLSPASGLEAVRAAVYAGADAVYTGGSKFGARAYANNLNEEELLKAIDFVHLHDRRLYLTVNTLLKEDEISQGLGDYLLPFYKQGLDAVIVQDLGVFSYIRKHFPELPVHISTQAVVTGSNAAAWYEKMGASRIVTARELSLEELRSICTNTSLEVESFVHGALCYCYSGQCFFSSFIGGRSGNRGRCAQPCRLPYRLLDDKGTALSKTDEQYLLSPKDMCALELLPDIIEAGVHSLKIEGRMKRLEYMAGVTEIYRSYVDLYYREGREGYRVHAEDRERLMDLFNRGNFHTGYYSVHNGREMMSPARPNHQGVYAGTIKKDKMGWRMKAQTALHPGDVLEMNGVLDKRSGKNLELIVSKEIQRSDWYVLPAKYEFLMKDCSSARLYRIKNEHLLKELSAKYADCNMQIPLTAVLHVKVHAPLALTIKGKVSVTVYGSVVEPAQTRPVEESELCRQISKTGNTEFTFCDIKVEMKENCFVPVKALNQLRREALEQYKQAVLKLYARTDADGWASTAAENRRMLAAGKRQKAEFAADRSWRCHVLLEQLEQLQLLLQYKQINTIYISMHAFAGGTFTERIERVRTAQQQCQNAGKQMYLVFPYIWRKAVEDAYLEVLPAEGISYLDAVLGCADGVVVRNLESFAFLMKQDSCADGRLPVYLDYSAYTMNGEAADAWQMAGASGITLPLELNKRELQATAERINLPKELVIYGHMPMMVSAQCLVKNVSGCRQEPQFTRLCDRMGSRHYVKNYCDTCYSVIYNSEPLCYLDWKEELSELSFDAVRLQFSVESEEEIRRIMGLYIQNFFGGEQMFDMPDTYTRGHWKRGVE